MTIQSPFVIRNGSCKIATVEYGSIITKMRLVPSQDVQTLRTVVPAGNVQDVDEPVWTFQITMGQDYTATTGLADILNTAAIAGTTLAVVMAPKLLGRNASFSIQAKSVDFGGDVGSFNTSDVEFPVIGQPTFGTDS